MGLFFGPKWVFYFGKMHLIIKRGFWSKDLKSEQRIGPHNIDVISVLVGNLLGDGFGEHRSGSTRLTLHLGLPNREYIAWLHSFYVARGYCSSQKLTFKKLIGKKGKIYFSTKIRTFSFKSLNWLYHAFYVTNEKGFLKKEVPLQIEELLTPLALAVWFQDDGGRSGSGTRIATHSFSLEGVRRLQQAILNRYNIKTSIHQSTDKWVLYFGKKETNLLYSVIGAYMHKSMEYKIKNS